MAITTPAQPRPTPSGALERRGRLYHPDFRGLVNYEIEPRPDDDDQATAQTIRRMWILIGVDAKSEIIRRAANQAAGTSPDPRKEVESIFAWVKRHVRFREDSAAVAPLAGLDAAFAEVLIRPVDLLTMPQPQGDCDDFAMLTAALLLAVGIEPELVTIAADRSQPGTYSHVYARAILPGGAIALDTSHGMWLGWEAPTAGKSKIWRLHEMNQPALGAIDWNALIEVGANTAAKITTARYGQPPVGTYSQSAAGDIFYRQPANAAALAFPGISANIGGGYTWILVAVAVFAVVMLMSKGRG